MLSSLECCIIILLRRKRTRRKRRRRSKKKVLGKTFFCVNTGQIDFALPIMLHLILCKMVCNEETKQTVSTSFLTHFLCPKWALSRACNLHTCSKIEIEISNKKCQKDYVNSFFEKNFIYWWNVSKKYHI